MAEEKKYSTVHYKNYLGLDKILDAQHLRSESVEGKGAHDEMLFIIIHQAYELWFKQIIHELSSVLNMFKTDDVDERSISTAVHRLERVVEIQQVLIQQIRIMETMTPLDFLDFRNHLFPASGFQSYQFRLIENLLGLQEGERLKYNGCPYFSVFDEKKQQELQEMSSATSLFEAIEDWLERTPFIQWGSFKFLEAYKESVSRMIAREEKAIAATEYLTPSEKEMRLSSLKNASSYYEAVFDKDKHAALQKKGEIRISYNGMMGALFINLYRDEPLLHLPFKLLVAIIEVDSALTTWRYRHAQMVLRMLGKKVGTGGSSGHEYLQATADKHHIFKDLHNISTLLIPRSELPVLPENVKTQLSYYYTAFKL